jgi:peptidoglycan/xylan/chitin deacetylase (PgdA/CDA1 family)
MLIALAAGALSSACNSAPTEQIGVATAQLSNIGQADGCSMTGSCYAGLLGGPWANVPLPAKVLSLTIDDGPGNFGAGIASYLAGLPVPIRATFFDNGNRFVTSTDLPNTNNIPLTAGADGIVTQILAQGHLIANHGVTHRDMATVVLPAGGNQLFKELSETDTDLAGYFPSGFYLFRAPYGDFNPGDYAALANTTMNKYVGPVYWDIGGVSTNYPDQAADWACWQGQITCGSVNAALGCPSVGALAYGTGYLTTQQCGDAYLKDIANFNAGIILTHDPYSWANGNTLAMLQYIIPKLQAEGYTFIRVDDVPEVRKLLPACDSSCTSCTGIQPNQCRACAAGRYLNGTSCPVCDSCTPGTYLAAVCTPTADTQCPACDPSCATCSGAGPDACTTCPTGSFLTAAGACQKCAVCAPGSFQTAACTPTSNTTCTACSPGTDAPDAGSLACVPCVAGTFAADAGAPTCQPCMAGSAAAPGQSGCTACMAGQTSDGGAAACSTCPAGSAAPSDSAECQTCAAGTYAAAGAGACTACVRGKFATSGAGSCTDCAAGSIAASAGMSACTPCPAGTYASSTGGSTCTACATGTFAPDAGATACTACGSCDDGKRCTLDQCDPATGCQHMAIPGCVPDAGVDAGSSMPTKEAGSDAGSDAGHDATSSATSVPDASKGVDAAKAPPSSATPSASGGCAAGGSAPVDGGAVLCGVLVLGVARRRRRQP